MSIRQSQPRSLSARSLAPRSHRQRRVNLGLALVLVTSVGCTFTGPTLDDTYTQLAWDAKLETLWEGRVLDTRYDQLPPLGAGWYADQAMHGYSLMLSGLGIFQMHEHVGDEMPAGRYKVTHQYGVMAKVEFVPVDEPTYSGLFKGAHGVGRFALAAPESLFDSYIPALALKFPVSGSESVDVLVTNALPGQGDNRNFFAKPFSNLVPPAQPEDGFLLNAVASHFATEDPNGDGTRLDIDHTVVKNQDGTDGGGVAPYQLVFEPHDDVGDLIASTSEADYREDLMRLTSGTTLYTVYALATEEADRVLVGTLVLRSEIVGSEWGDRHVFFRHRL